MKSDIIAVSLNLSLDVQAYKTSTGFSYFASWDIKYIL